MKIGNQVFDMHSINTALREYSNQQAAREFEYVSNKVGLADEIKKLIDSNSNETVSEYKLESLNKELIDKIYTEEFDEKCRVAFNQFADELMEQDSDMGNLAKMLGKVMFCDDYLNCEVTVNFGDNSVKLTLADTCDNDYVSISSNKGKEVKVIADDNSSMSAKGDKIGLDKTPATGDNTNLMLLVAVLLVSVASAVGFAYVCKKNR